MSLPLAAPKRHPSRRGFCTLAEVTNILRRANVVSMHFWGALMDRAPHQTRILEPRMELNVEMSPSLSSTARSLVEAFDLVGVLGHLQVDLEPTHECISNLRHVTAACEGLLAIVQTGPEAIKGVDGSREGLLRDGHGSSTPPCLGEGVPTLPSVHTSSRLGKATTGVVSSPGQDDCRHRDEGII